MDIGMLPLSALRGVLLFCELLGLGGVFVGSDEVDP